MADWKRQRLGPSYVADEIVMTRRDVRFCATGMEYEARAS